MSSFPRPQIKSPHLRRVTADTKFHIDYSWWEQSNLDLKTYLITRLSLGDSVSLDAQIDKVDLIDARTGEVRQVDGFQYLVQNYFSQQRSDLVGQGSLVDAVFSVLLSNGNQPMALDEIAERVHRPVDLLIRTFGGSQIYQGIRPVFDEE